MKYFLNENMITFYPRVNFKKRVKVYLTLIVVSIFKLLNTLKFIPFKC